MSAEIQANATCAIAGMGNHNILAINTSPALSWPRAPGAVRPTDDEIHIWCVILSDFCKELPQFYGLLSSAEQVRAERFRFRKNRDDYVIRHAILRIILSWYLELPPTEIDFCYRRFGKPEIKGDPVRKRLNFSASHSGDVALYAVTRSCSVGVDVERLGPVPHFQEMASQFFSPRESEMLMGLPTEFRMAGFFACWTCKEALLKATGEGIGEGLAKVEVKLTSWEEPEILRTTAESKARTDWQLRSFSPAPGYLAAVAFRHRDLTFRQWKVHAPSV